MAKKKKKQQQREQLAEFWQEWQEGDDDGSMVELSDAMLMGQQRQFALNAAMMALGVGPWGGVTIAANEVLAYAAAIDKFLTTGHTVPLDDILDRIRPR